MTTFHAAIHTLYRSPGRLPSPSGIAPYHPVTTMKAHLSILPLPYLGNKGSRNAAWCFIEIPPKPFSLTPSLWSSGPSACFGAECSTLIGPLFSLFPRQVPLWWAAPETSASQVSQVDAVGDTVGSDLLAATRCRPL